MKSTRKYTSEHIGEWFQFHIIDKVLLKADMQYYWQIEDIDLFRFMVPFEPYRKYQLTENCDWWFKLDYIDCDGKYIFEPRHPVYSEKSLAYFKISAKKEIKNYLGLSETVLEIENAGEGSNWVRLAKCLDSDHKEQEVFIERIKAGEMLIFPANDHQPIYRTGSFYSFYIIDELDLNQFGNSFLLQDEYGNMHAIPKEPYRFYDLRIGGKIEAEIQRISSKGFLYLEPLHPVYRVNTIQCFEILDILKRNDSLTGFAIDIFGNMIKIEQLSIECKKDMVIQARISKIQRGIPQCVFYDFCR